MTLPEIDERFTADILDLASRIKDNWTLCEFMGNSEREYMVAETIHAARINLKAHGQPFSFRGDGVFGSSGGGLINNGAAYRYLIDEGYFVEGEHETRVVIYPTRKLLDKLIGFLDTKARH